MKLWLDDVRDPAKHGAIGFVWLKTAEEAAALLATGAVEFASLDHDLSVAATMGNPTPEECTGYDLVCWMERENIWPPKGVRVHSQNPAGKRRMEAAINRHYCSSSSLG